MSLFSYLRTRPLSLSLGIALALVGCQKELVPSASLSTTDIPVNTQLTADPTAESTITPYRTRVDQTMNEVIGQAPEAIDRGQIESPLGNFVADLSRTQTMTVYGKPIDMGGMTNGGLRNPLDKGPVTVGDVFEMMPFENEMMVLTLSGETVQELFDFAARTKILFVANASYTLRNGKAESIFIGGKPFDANKTYTLAISDYLANGGDNMGFLKKALKTEQTGLLARDAILNEIKQLTAQGKPVVSQKDGRVKVVN
ncbi:5'-nucleotidase C-terminal domain-containing protein [Rufibacter sediminis]|uniref:5'-nucleotidase C-terminal domain-containing protein n=1 Tax=Rufibacter sediminis TaxID=2762756 RepID=A0ABR6VWH8_9BACT|nr:5'-nucleotidase C-terminal domain-containing protein [Rufibacter sediminis]MBC3541305.1 5'-nucleotidase C-terminal domain-containing protein [Rufibacter sediminis]